MESTITVSITRDERVMDIVSCDRCKKVLDMNLNIKDRKNRFKPEDIQTTGRYFDLRHYDRDLEEVEHTHLCADCMKAEVATWCDPSSDEEIEYDLESHIGKIIPKELEVQAAAVEKDKAEAKARYEAEKIKAVEQSIAEEDAMLKGLFGQQLHL